MSTEEKQPENAAAEGQNAGRGGIAILFAKVFFLLTGLVQQALLSRVIGQDGYGALSRVLAAANIPNNVVVSGSIQAMSRTVSQSGKNDQAAFRAAMRLHVPLALFLGGAFAMAAPFYASFQGTREITLPLVVLFLRDSPSEVGLRPLGAVVDDPPIVRENPFTAAIGGLATASRNRTFWLLTASFFICGATTNGLIGTHLIPASIDHGMSGVTAASLLAVIGVFDLIGTLCSGWLTDRYDPRWLLFWYYGLRGLSLLALPFVIGSSNLGLIVFVVFYGLDWVATVPPTVAITAQVFGRERVGIVFGWIFGAHQLGAATAAFGAGAARTWFGDYQGAFITAGLLSLVAAGLVIRIFDDRRRPAPIGSAALEPGS